MKLQFSIHLLAFTLTQGLPLPSLRPPSVENVIGTAPPSARRMFFNEMGGVDRTKFIVKGAFCGKQGAYEVCKDVAKKKIDSLKQLGNDKQHQQQLQQQLLQANEIHLHFETRAQEEAAKKSAFENLVPTRQSRAGPDFGDQ